jgi:hypothetical protein
MSEKLRFQPHNNASMKHGMRHILRSLFITAIVATLTILILRGRDPTFLSFHNRSPAEIALSRVIKRVNFQRIPFYQAIDTLSQAAGIKIECDDEDALPSAYHHSATLSAEQITLGDALRELLVSASDDELHCFAEGDRIRIGYREASAGPMYVDEYVLPGVALSPEVTSVGGLFSGTSRSALPLLDDYGRSDALDMLLFRTDRTRMSDCVGVVWPPHLFALMPASSHQEARKVFEALRPEATPAARRKLPFGTDVLDFVDGRFRARSGRAANDALHSILPPIVVERQPVDKALKLLGARMGLRISLTDDLADVASFDVDLDAREVTLASALRTLLAQVLSSDIEFEPEGDAIWIFPANKLRLFRVYDLRRAFVDRSNEESADLLQRIRAAVPRREEFDFNDENEGLLGSILVVRGTWDELEGYEKSILKCLNGADSNRAATHP